MEGVWVFFGYCIVTGAILKGLKARKGCIKKNLNVRQSGDGTIGKTY